LTGQEPEKEILIRTKFFDSVKDQRGILDDVIIQMIMLSHELPSCWSSVSKMTGDWIKDSLGETSQSVQQFVQQNEVDIENKIKLMTKMICDFYQKNLFSDVKKTFNKFYLPYKFVVSRCCYFIKDYAIFNRISSNIVQKLLSEVFIDNIQSILDCNSRNAVFQQKIIEKIDKIIQDELNQEGSTRRFPKKMILEKLAEQKNVCPGCNLAIKEGDKYEGDHIVSWTAGGKTICENLQVLHQRCHQIKSSG
jgi:hypothetical protein